MAVDPHRPRPGRRPRIRDHCRASPELRLGLFVDDLRDVQQREVVLGRAADLARLLELHLPFVPGEAQRALDVAARHDVVRIVVVVGGLAHQHHAPEALAHLEQLGRVLHLVDDHQTLQPGQREHRRGHRPEARQEVALGNSFQSSFLPQIGSEVMGGIEEFSTLHRVNSKTLEIEGDLL